MSIAASAPHKQAPFSKIVSAVASARTQLRAGASLNSVIRPALLNVPLESRPAAQALIYESVRRCARTTALVGLLCSRQPSAEVLSVLETAFAAFSLGRLAVFTVVSETVTAAKANPFEMKELIARINAVLRRYLREKDELEKKIASRDEVRFNAPAWWIGRIRTIYPKDADRILELGTRHPPMTLRVNVRLMTVEDYLDRLKAAGLEARRVGPEAIELVTPVPVDRIPGFADGTQPVGKAGNAVDGLSSVQDAGTQLAAHLLPVKAGDRVLDACSAPGGKTAHILERADCAMTALEIDPARAVKVRETLDRLKLKADIRTADAGDTASWWDGKPFDAILLDAPCTASGVVRRQPDTPWLRRPDDIKKLASEQKRLLKTLWPLLRKGGRMLYATCSIFPEEGTGQMKAFLAATPDARLVPLFAGNDGMLTLLPEESGEWRSDAQLPTVHDGFFYALLEKQA